jgi:c-di-GMP-binding flagellar brake protein YcgR
MSANADLSGHLLRSSAEIARVVEALVAQRVPVSARLPSEAEQFSSQIVHADPDRRFIVVMLARNDAANAALLALPRVTFESAFRDWHFEFVAAGPRKVVHAGTQAIRLSYPEVLAAQQRRQHPRLDVPASSPLRCLADAGGIMPFDAEIVDISPGGIGFLLYAPEITLEPATRLQGCRIEVPARDPIVVDLEVRYSEVVTLAGGRRARRSGCRFVNGAEAVKELLGALGNPPSG